MRYRPEHKAETHQKIVKDASRRIRAEGITGAAVSAVMRDAGLTHGGFYKHFTSKDDLLVESVREAFRDFAEKLVHAAEQSRSEEPWKAIVQFYLSVKHCDDPSHGCPITALGPELARVEAGMRGQFFADIVNYKNTLVPFMPGRRAVDKESAFFAIFSTMIGAMQLARALPHRATQEKVLANARDFLLRSF